MISTTPTTPERNRYDDMRARAVAGEHVPEAELTPVIHGDLRIAGRK